MAQEFYERHGGKTIILAKFVPIIRTFAPVVAGAGRMPYRRFLPFSVVGAVSWIVSMILLGYTLHLWLDPLLKPIFGPRVRGRQAHRQGHHRDRAAVGAADRVQGRQGLAGEAPARPGGAPTADADRVTA